MHRVAVEVGAEADVLVRAVAAELPVAQGLRHVVAVGDALEGALAVGHGRFGVAHLVGAAGEAGEAEVDEAGDEVGVLGHVAVSLRGWFAPLH